jgi:hypothetical protein
MKEEIGDSWCAAYVLVWLWGYPIRFALRYMAKSCRKYARADEGTIRHLATVHALQSLLFGPIVGILSAYLLFVDGLYHTQEAMGLSSTAVVLLRLSVVLCVLAMGYTVGSINCDANVHALAQRRLTTKVPAQVTS